MTEPLSVEFTIPPAHPALPGHFPGHPIVPGVVIIDEVVRAIERAVPQRIRVTGASAIKFLAPLLPGEAVTITLQNVDNGMLRFAVSRGDTTLAAGQFFVQLL